MDIRGGWRTAGHEKCMVDCFETFHESDTDQADSRGLGGRRLQRRRLAAYQAATARSSSDETNLPAAFGDRENIAWKAPLPGRGPSCPIVVAGRVIITCGSGRNQDRLHVLCIDAGSGKPLWQRQLAATGVPGASVRRRGDSHPGQRWPPGVRVLRLERSGLLRSRWQPAMVSRAGI